VSLEENIKNRRWMLERIRAEVVGPDPVDDPEVIIGLNGPSKLTKNEYYKKKKRQSNGEEVVWQDPPIKRYGAGILYPSGVSTEESTTSGESPFSESGPTVEAVSEEQLSQNEKLISRKKYQVESSEDYDVTLANAFRPSAIGLSFLVDMEREPLGVEVDLVSIGRLGANEFSKQHSALYRKSDVYVGDKPDNEFERVIWFRVPLQDDDGGYPRVKFESDILVGTGVKNIKASLPCVDGVEVVLVSRPWVTHTKSDSKRLLTVSIVNRKQLKAKGVDSDCIFQAGIRIRGLSGNEWVLPYPDEGKNNSQDLESEEAINRLLYREHHTFAIGHGCAADWAGSPLDGTSEVWSDVLPAYETPPVTADLEIENPDGSLEKIKVSMRKLAGLDPDDTGRQELDELVDAYRTWINNLKTKRLGVPEVPSELIGTADELVERCNACLKRIEDGLKLLDEESLVGEHARNAFKVANHAMLIAQL